MWTLRHWMMGKCNKVTRTKTTEQKLVGTLGDSGTKTVEQKQQNKNSEIKIGGDPQRPQVQKGQWNKNCRTKTVA